MRFEDFVGKAGADFTDCLVFLGGGVVAGEEVGAVDVCSFSTAVEGAYDDKIETITYSRKVVFLNLHRQRPATKEQIRECSVGRTLSQFMERLEGS